jgi:hypothetical protein
MEISDTSLLNVLIEKEMEEVKLTFQKRKDKMLRKKMKKEKSLNDEENSLEARERGGESSPKKHFV